MHHNYSVVPGNVGFNQQLLSSLKQAKNIWRNLPGNALIKRGCCCLSNAKVGVCLLEKSVSIAHKTHDLTSQFNRMSGWVIFVNLKVKQKKIYLALFRTEGIPAFSALLLFFLFQNNLHWKGEKSKKIFFPNIRFMKRWKKCSLK